MASIYSRFKKFNLTKKILTVILILIVVWGIYYFAFAKKGPAYQFITVTKGNIIEKVSVTGNTTPVKSLDLGFQSGGTIANVNYDVGNHVGAGAIITSLDTRDLQAQLAQAQANVDAQSAQLKNLQAGAQPADIEASRAALDKGKQDLANMYAVLSDKLADSYSKANDAIRTQLSSFFSNAESINPILNFQVSNSQTQINIESGRSQTSIRLNDWQTQISQISSLSAPSILTSNLQNALSNLSLMKNLMINALEATNEATGISSSSVNSYKSLATTGLNEINTAISNLNTASQNISSQEILVKQLQAQLDLKIAGSTLEQIAAQQAQVVQAQASARSIQVKILQSSLIAPISGIITIQNAKVGQVATSGAKMVSIISDSGLEIDAFVPETDIGRIAVNDPVDMTIDAFQNETFTGKIFYIDPAETVVSGVVDYKIKAAFDKPDSRIRSGLTVNLNIKTEEKDNVLVLPQYAIIQNDQGTFVKKLENGKVTEAPVVLGIHDEKGNTEIISGVSENEKVINIGLK